MRALLPPACGEPPASASRRRFLAGAGALLGAAVAPPAPARTAESTGGASARYDGMDDGAAWRREALQRIETLRKGDFQIAVTDARGKGLPGVELHVALYRHHFGFGGAIQQDYLLDDGAADRQAFYRDATERLFHRVTVANGLKWRHYATQRPQVEQFLDWCRERELPVRGHCLVWPRFRRIPDELHGLRADPPALRRAIEQRIVEMMSRYDAPLIEWDVLNEPFTEHEFMDLLGAEVVHDWFRLAERTNPRLTRWINDFGVLTRPSRQHQDFYFEYVRGLLAAGVPVQGIGFQGHIPREFRPTPPEELIATMDRFATLGLPLQVTEFDFETTDEDLQARYTSDFLVAVFSHPAMTGLVTWTPFEYQPREGPKPDAAFYDHGLREKPNGQVWQSLVNGAWRTEQRLVTDAHGRAALRGFYGGYRIEASRGGATTTATGKLLPAQRTMTITLQGEPHDA